MGSINTHRELIARLSKAAQARILALDYRLASEHPFPAPVEDATAAYRWMLAQGLKPFTDRGCRRLRGWRPNGRSSGRVSRRRIADAGGGNPDFTLG